MTKAKTNKLIRKIRNKEDKNCAIAIKNRDGNKCVICGKEERLNAHHIIPHQIKELRHDYMNFISLCPAHHKFSFKISPHRNPFMFITGLEKNRPEQYCYLKSKTKEIECQQ